MKTERKRQKERVKKQNFNCWMEGLSAIRTTFNYCWPLLSWWMPKTFFKNLSTATAAAKAKNRRSPKELNSSCWLKKKANTKRNGTQLIDILYPVLWICLSVCEFSPTNAFIVLQRFYSCYEWCAAAAAATVAAIEFIKNLLRKI